MYGKLFVGCACLLFFVGATAETQRYRLDPKGSDVSAKVAFSPLPARQQAFPK